MPAVLIHLWVVGLIATGLLAGAFFASLPVEPGFDGCPVATRAESNDAFSVATVLFPCGAEQCEAWLYLPAAAAAATPPPVIVMAHGLGAQKDFLLADGYAEPFARRGYAVFVFDYRSFGGSTGDVRNWVFPQRHAEDFAHALDYVVAHADTLRVDAANIGLWGTSFSGGHVLVTAASSPHAHRIKAVISQIPFVDSRASVGKRSLRYSLSVGALSAMDILAALLGLDRIYINLRGGLDDIVALPGAGASMDTLVPQKRRGCWQNRVTASFVLTLMAYRPIRYAPAVSQPVLVAAASNDDLCPIEAVRATVAAIPNARLIERPTGHFGMYLPETRHPLVAEMAAFFDSHLRQ